MWACSIVTFVATCRFSFPGEAWRLVPCPIGILETIEHHLEFLTNLLTSVDILKSVESNRLVSFACCVLQDILTVSTVLARVAGVSQNSSELMKGHNLIPFIIKMVQNLIKLVRKGEGREGERECVCVWERERILINSFKPLQISVPLSDNNFSFLQQSLIQCITFIHCLADPMRNWQRVFMRYSMNILTI